jgi:hypothetical protein
MRRRGRPSRSEDKGGKWGDGPSDFDTNDVNFTVLRFGEGRMGVAVGVPKLPKNCYQRNSEN